MNFRVMLSLVLFLVGIQTLWAAGPGLPQLLSSTAGQQVERSIRIIPDPAVLRADWWLYFNVSASELDERASKLRHLLTRRYGVGAQADDQIRAAAIGRVLSNLDAFVAARQVQPTTPPPIPDASEIYSPGLALELVSSLRQARQAVQFDLNDVSALKDAADTARRDIDIAMAAYLQLDAIDDRRVPRGLEIIADRLALATSDIQLALRRAALSARQARVDALEVVERRAEQRLRGDAQETAELGKALKAAVVALGIADKELANAKRRMLQSTAATVEDQLTARFRQQRVTRASIEQLARRVALRRINLQQVLNGILLEDVTVPLALGHEQIELTRQLIEQARPLVATLQTGSELERDRAGEQLASTGLREAVLLINQRRLRLAQESIGQIRLLNDQLTQLEFLSRWTATAIRGEESLVERILGSIADMGLRIQQSAGAVTDQTLFRLGETPITLSGVFKVLVVVIIAWMVSWVLRRMIGQLGNRFPKENQSVLFVIGRLAHYLIIMIGILAGLSSIGLSFANFALVAGALALGLGFGLQTIVNNFLSGLILFFERTVKVGDFVELDNGERGEVRSINVRGTIVNTNDNVDVIVPNSQFTERKVVNWTLLDPFRRIHVPFRVAYSADEDKVVEAGLDAAHRLSSTLTGVLGREPSVWLVNYGENGFEFELIVWLMPDAVRRPDAVFAAYHWEIRKALRRHDIEVPVPQREIRFRQPVPAALQEAVAPQR